MALDCGLYCMGLSAFGMVFLTYLGILVGTDSETMWLHIPNKGASMTALFFTAFMYALIFAYLYYFKFFARTDRDGVKRYIELIETKNQNVALSDIKEQ